MQPANRGNILLGIFLLSAIIVQAQYKFEKAALVSTENGLPVNDIRSISKSEEGFIWIGTSEGLCRFDGVQVKVFREGKDYLRSMFDHTVSAVLAVKNKIWIGTKQGLSVLNTNDYTFRHYQFGSNGKTDQIKRRYDQNVSFLYRDKFGKIWIGTSDRGVAVYDETKDNFQFFSIPAGKYPPLVPALGSNNGILNITSSINNDSVIWAGTMAGLQKINKYTGRVELFTFPQTVKDFQVAVNVFRRLYHHDDGLLYVGSWAAGVSVFDPVNKTLNPVEAKTENGNKFLRTAIGNLTRKSEHEFWISSGLGLAIYDTRVKDVTWYKFNNAAEMQFYSIGFIDEANRVWYADINGLNYYDPAVQQFTNYSYKHLTKSEWTFAFYIIPDQTGNKITVCPRFTDCIYLFDKIKKEWTKTKFPNNENFIPELDGIKGFAQLSPGEFVIASDKGVYLYSANKKTIKQVNAGPSFSPNRRGDLLADRKGNIWMSDNTWGLTQWNPKTGKVINYKKETNSADTIGPLNRLLNLYEDSHGNIWFQRQGGLGVYMAEQEKIASFIYIHNEAITFPTAYGFAEDKNGRVWVSSVDGWIGYAYAAHPEKGIVKKINIHEKGIPGDIQRLATDRNGDVWGHTLKELVKIRADNLSFRTYDFKYGAGEADFYHFSFLPDGEMIFGGRNDITIANPAELKRNTELPLPYISEINVLNQPYRDLQKGEQLKLKYKENFFSIGFSSIAYTMPAGVKYRFRLSGFDNWSEPTDRRFANYTNVPGGDYTFQLQAANNEGTWNNTILELPVHISTPYWNAWWFRIAAILLLALIVYSAYLFRVNQFRKKEKLKLEYEKKIANVEMSSLLAQMNPHFLFNSLNSIDSYIIKHETHKASEYLNNFARLMRLILQNSRSNYISLKDELEALDLYLQMEGLRFQNKFEYEIKVDDSINTSSVVIPPMLIQPFVENAIWHGLMHKEDGDIGKVQINISMTDNKLKCAVQDNGIGRGRAEELKLQKSGNRKRSMGMQITNDRIEMINKLYGTNTKVKVADLFDNNGKANGTKVELEIPV